MKNLLDSHTHTLASGHAYNTITEMVQAASRKGLSLLAITEHAEMMPGSCNNIYFQNLKVLPHRMAGIEVLYGVEANIMNYAGELDVPERILSQLDVVIASLHLPCIKPGTREVNTQAVLRAIENPLVDIIGHPDDGRYPLDYEKIVSAAREHHVLLELNNHSLDPSCARENTWENVQIMLKLCREYGVSIIMDSDAHWCEDIADCRYSPPLLQELDFPMELVVNRSVELYKSYLHRFSARRRSDA